MLDKVDRKVLDDIERTGWAAISVFPTEDDLGPGNEYFTYTVGMTKHDHPDMKASSNDIVAAIEKVQAADYGVVALVFTKGGRKMEIQILDEPFDPNVRLFPGV